jgi:Fe-S-cluster-containing hydrogenase component 2
MARAFVLLAALGVCAAAAHARLAFEPPDFSGTPHTMPVTLHPDPPARALVPQAAYADQQPHDSVYSQLQYVDLAVLVAALIAAAWLGLRARSRKGLVILGLSCLAYLGFWRVGCVCPIGSSQNIALGVADANYIVPLTVVAFFLLPVAAALLFGRTFCSSVCPMGAMQDVVLLKPVAVPNWLSRALGVLPWVYLSFAIMTGVLGGAFLICRYDPFVGFFRFSGPAYMLAAGGAILLIGMFVGRPYCRFLCPYGALLGCASRLARRHVTITPSRCVSCRQCENACPFGAIQKPAPAPAFTPARPILAGVLGLAALAACAWGGKAASAALAQTHPLVRTAQLVQAQEAHPDEEPSNEAAVFAASGEDPDELYVRAMAVVRRFDLGGAMAGAVVGLVVGLKIAAALLPRRRDFYEPNKWACVSCGRCFEACPVHRAGRQAQARQPAAAPETQA